MLDWNDYRTELLARIGDLGQLSPDTVRGYSTLSGAGAKTGHLDAKTRELIAIAVGVTLLSLWSNGLLDALTRQELVVASEVTRVGAERVGCETPLDREVVEIGAHSPSQRHARAHPRTLSSSTGSMPTASPTGALVSSPAWVLRPSARLWSSRRAWAQPLSATATT